MPSTEKARSVMKDLVQAFSSKKFPEVAAKAYISAPDIPSSKWSLNNKIAMFIHGTADARGFNQWQDVGRHVKKGSKAVYILGPRLIKTRDENDEEKKKLIGFRVIPVFRYEDTEGNPLPTYEPAALPPLFDLAKHNGITVKYTNTVSGEYGSITTDGRNMTLSTESPDTFLHELMHFYDLRNRKDVKGGQDKTQEIVAQLGACVLAKMYGYDSTEYTWNYISAYSKTDNPEKIGKECIAVLDRVDKAISAILADAKSTAPQVTSEACIQ